MGKKKTVSKRAARAAAGKKPSLWISPDTYVLPYQIQVFGAQWGFCPIGFLVDDQKPVRPARILVGESRRDAVEPIRGEFMVLLNIPGLKAGQHQITAVIGDQKTGISASFSIEDSKELEKDGRPTHRWLRRQEHFMRQRFPDGVDRRPGSRIQALEHRDRMRARKRDDTAPPVGGVCNWQPIGPSVVRKGQVFATASTYTTAPISGRVTSIAYDPHNTNIVYLASAMGGVWKSIDAGLNWRPKSDYAVSLAIGCVTVDPSVTDASGNSTRILAGTGEPNTSDSYYGAGMLFSNDGGDTWVVRGTPTFTRAAFSTIAVDPANNQHMYAATDQGVYESTDEGVNWTQIEPGICHDLVVDWTNVGGAELYVGKKGVGVRRSQDGGVSWTTLGGGLPASSGRIALAKAPSDSSTLYAAFASGSNLTGIYRTTDGGTNWTPTTTVPPGVSQAAYNLVLAVHPTDPNIVLFGEVHLWRTINAGGAWTRVSIGSPGIHADQHAITFHPTNGNLVFAGNDGGVFYSNDGGVTYTHRNKDLATLQYWAIANHSLWDAIMLGGTQDNGAQRYLGHPAWEHSALGDGAYAAINSTTDIRKWFESRWYSFPCFRSDSAGSAGSWNQKQSGISTNSNWFYPPMVMDASNSAVLYVGYDELWRTANNGDTWTAITGSLIGTGTNITAIAVAPSNSNIVYVGLQDGSVFRIVFSMGVWTPTNVTNAVLPAGQVSDIAVHPTDPNIVYVSTSDLIFSEGSESFANDHVFRTTNGGTNWTSISAGLSQANPVNAIAIDPTNPNTVFIGCDVGVFRSTNANTAATWTVWDEGLPNCSVQDLQVFGPQRLIRAGTHGRSIWERHLDSASCPLVDVYLRDDFVDTGRSLPPPSNVEHPFTAGEWMYWWQSVDIKIDSPDPATNVYQTPTRDIDYIQFEELTHDSPRRDTWVRAYVQMHNRGNNPATNVRVRAFWADASGQLPNFPPDFWTAFPNADPVDTTVWHPVGPSRTIPLIYPGQPVVASWSWYVPGSAATHTCMLAVVKSDEDNVTTNSLDVGTAVTMDNNVTLKNLHVDAFVPGAGGADEGIGPYFIDFSIFDREPTIDIRFRPGVMPKGARILAFFPTFRTRRPIEQSLSGFRLVSTSGIRIPERPEESCGRPTQYNVRRGFQLDVDPVKHRDEVPGIYGIVPAGQKFSAAFFIRPPKEVKPGEILTFHIEHWAGQRLVGGSSYELRAQAPDTQKGGRPKATEKRRGSRPSAKHKRRR
jgi:photosystem II stability/assembly factor-like uncharacterized protein